MKFITVEQFYKADKKVRDSIMEWWEPNEYDLISYYDIILLTKQLKRGHESIKAELTPLLTVGQLIEFIEWKTKQRVEVRYNYFNNNVVKIAVVSVNSFCIESFNTNILIDALWFAVQKIFE